MNEKLKPEYILFVSNYLSHFDGVKALKQSNIMVKRPSQKVRELLNKIEIKNEIKRQLTPTLQENEVTKQEIIKYLSDIMRNKLTEKVMVKLKNEDGSESIYHEVCEISQTVKLKAIDQLTKILKIYTESENNKPNITINCTVPKPPEFEGLDD